MSHKLLHQMIGLALVVLLLAECAPAAMPPTLAPFTTTPRPTLMPIATPSSPAALVQAEFARLAAGRILYNPPQEMTVARRERIEVRITQSMTTSLTEGLQGSGAPQVEQIPVASFMKVRLLGEGFKITPLSSEEQIVVGNTFTQWMWDVTPLEAGQKSLIIVVTARVKLAGFSDEQKDLNIIERKISVRVNPVYSIQTFFNENLDWLFPAVLIPLIMGIGGWVWRSWHNKARSGSRGNSRSGTKGRSQ